VTFLTDRVVPAAAVLVAGLILAFVARAVVARLLARVLPGDEGRARSQVRGAARGVMWFLSSGSRPGSSRRRCSSCC
jgi:hypothetical protein